MKLVGGGGEGMVGTCINVEKLQHHLASCIMVHMHHHSNVILGQNVKHVNAVFHDVLLNEVFAHVSDICENEAGVSASGEVTVGRRH